jgi:catechol 2,3-dioxygenase-like lactoylglutathione lyase family enzyme
MMADNTSPMSEMFGAYLQVADLGRSLSFYRDVLALRADWNDGALAILHGRDEPANTLILREIGGAAPHHVGEVGVTRVFWRVRDPTDLDSAEERLVRQEVPYRRHRDGKANGIAMHDPDGLEVVLLWIGEDIHTGAPPAWLYWYH